MDHLSVAGGGVDDGSSACHDAHMTLYDHDVSGLKVVEIADLCILPDASPAGGGDITLAHASLIQAPVHKTGAVKTCGRA